ncbi:helix-turn-helix transcriptional regulator [Gloeocapsa sp. PCC 73106]|uniref:ArsR/SmtB family transcription factor n=1 Tax=Gloeocapsa sp. PCC 73106 TaxID=102232 RepID=UPI0002AC1726|nr:metalloregulator ArsR/SmtB family transcription factor [Gloeocapsa sp. PCC 73106]ELR96565.1 putative transcriptional regulator [Gloeocapsa sp. PCC 73106]
MQGTTTSDLLTILTGFRALAEPIRLQILECLRFQELCVCELSSKLNIGQSKLSFHLKALREAGLLHSRHEGRWIYYSLNLSQLVDLERYLAEYRRASPVLPTRNTSK